MKSKRGICRICGVKTATRSMSFCPEHKPATWSKGKVGISTKKIKTRICAYCAKEFQCPYKTLRYCSDECRKAGRPPIHNKGVKTGIPSPKRNGTAKSCEICGKSFYVCLSSKDARFCSMKCNAVARWGQDRIVTIPCVICQKPITKQKSAQRTCCSEKCSRQHKSNCHQGEKSRLWRGGKCAPYHRQWRSIRREAFERDGYKCMLCGCDKNISVHHIIPFRYSQDHGLENLATLCRPCHSREELKVNPKAVEGLKARWKSLLERSENT
jgi:5-methylcytosine-specific restriction protein A